jgi:hypothetical protein
VSLRLIRLDCPSCGSSLRAEPRDILYLCSHCGQGAVLSGGGLETVQSSAILPVAGRRAQVWRPGWLLETEVSVSGRVRAGGGATPGRSGPRRFVIPAFPLPLSSFAALARALSSEARETGEVPREPLPGGTLVLEDALTLARYLVVSEEVAKPDLLAAVEVTVEERGHQLVALPFEHDGEQLRCAVSGVTVSVEA